MNRREFIKLSALFAGAVFLDNPLLDAFTIEHALIYKVKMKNGNWYVGLFLMHNSNPSPRLLIDASTFEVLENCSTSEAREKRTKWRKKLKAYSASLYSLREPQNYKSTQLQSVRGSVGGLSVQKIYKEKRISVGCSIAWHVAGGRAQSLKLNTEKVQCPKCKEWGPMRSWRRYHFDNCSIPQDPFGHIPFEEFQIYRKKGTMKRNLDQKTEAERQKRLMYMLSLNYEKIQVTKFWKYCGENGIATNVFGHLQDNMFFQKVFYGKAKKRSYYVAITSCPI